MAAVSTMILAAGLALSAVGAGVQFYGSMQQAAANKKSLALQQEIEAQRQKQMNLDAQRRQREIIRQRVQARAQALAATTAQGASGGSALEGAYGGISGRSNVNALGVSQNQEIGNSIFSLNSQVLGAYRASAAGQATSSMGQGLSSFGGMLLKNEGALNRIGSFVSNGFGRNSGY